MLSLYLECLARIVPPRAIRSSLIFTSLLRCIVLLICVVLPGSASAQVHRDRTALSAIAGSIARFGGLPPVDSVAVAKVTVTSGTSTQVGTMRIVTRGMDETREEIKLKGTSESLVFSKGSSSEKRKSTKPGKDPYSFELSLTAQSPLFPLPWLASRYANNDTAIEDLGAETSDGTVSSHLRLTNTFTSNPMLKHYAPFTASDLWLDAGLGLRKISYERREAGGSTAAIPVSIEYSDYRNVQGLLYPFQIRKYINGTLWAVISIQSVTFNSGVSDTEFALKQEKLHEETAMGSLSSCSGRFSADRIAALFVSPDWRFRQHQPIQSER